MINSLAFARHGDKKNSPFFEEYLQLLLNNRDKSGLSEMIGEIEAMCISLEPGAADPEIIRMGLTTKYEYCCTYDAPNHVVHRLVIPGNIEIPEILLFEVKDETLFSVFRNLNKVSPNGILKPHTRYLGEIFRTENLSEVFTMQQEKEIRFFDPELRYAYGFPKNTQVTQPSAYTNNILGYVERPEGSEKVWHYASSFVDEELKNASMQAKQKQEELQIRSLIDPIDHLATRIYSQNRESAILEFLTLSSYYYWGSYDIEDQNSSTNVTKNIREKDESFSPAKVFTANNVPYFVNHIVQKPSPTENFVRNYGPRMHHIAVTIADGITNGKENIEYVVEMLKQHADVDFLLNVIGSAQEGLKQIFSKSSPHSYLITEYVQRYNGFEGFFTKGNVAFLTKAAGEEEGVKDGLSVGEKCVHCGD